MNDKNLLSEPEKILELEYEYIEETIHQSIQDRYKMLNFYIALSSGVGSVAIGLFSLMDFSASDGLLSTLALMFFMIFIVGLIFLSMMIWLRLSWYRSIMALSKLKEYYANNSKIDMEAAFLWRADTIPKPDKFWNIHFYVTLLIVLLSSLFLCTSVFCLLNVLNAERSIILAVDIILFIASVTAQLIIYKIALR